MKNIKEIDQQFLEGAYEKVLDRLESSSDICDLLSDGSKPYAVEVYVNAMDLSRTRRQFLRGYARGYVCGMLNIMFDEYGKDNVFTESRLENLCAKIDKQGLTEDRAKHISSVAKQVFLEDLFSTDFVYHLQRVYERYSICRKSDGLYVLEIPNI